MSALLVQQNQTKGVLLSRKHIGDLFAEKLAALDLTSLERARMLVEITQGLILSAPDLMKLEATYREQTARFGRMPKGSSSDCCVVTMTRLMQSGYDDISKRLAGAGSDVEPLVSA